MPTKIIALGVVLAALVIGGGNLNSHRIELKLRDLQTDCLAEAKQEKSTYSKSTGEHLVAVIICDPKELENDSNLVGIQSQLVEAIRELRASEIWHIR